MVDVVLYVVFIWYLVVNRYSFLRFGRFGI